MTDKSNPIALARVGYQRTGYTHQGWLSEDQRFFVFGDETDEKSYGFDTKTLVLNVESLTNPVIADIYFGTTSAIDHNQYIRNDTIYQANYRAGLRVLKVNDYGSADFDEVGSFDVYRKYRGSLLL